MQTLNEAAELRTQLMNVIRAQNPKKTVSELILRHHHFAKAYAQNHPNFLEMRKVFWEKLGMASTTKWGQTVFEFSPTIWVRMDDSASSAYPAFCFIGETKYQAESFVDCVEAETIQQAFAYILSKVY